MEHDSPGPRPAVRDGTVEEIPIPSIPVARLEVHPTDSSMDLLNHLLTTGFEAGGLGLLERLRPNMDPEAYLYFKAELTQVINAVFLTFVPHNDGRNGGDLHITRMPLL